MPSSAARATVATRNARTAEQAEMSRTDSGWRLEPSVRVRKDDVLGNALRVGAGVDDFAVGRGCPAEATAAVEGDTRTIVRFTEAMVACETDATAIGVARASVTARRRTAGPRNRAEIK